jgi:hypothetical protein
MDTIVESKKEENEALSPMRIFFLFKNSQYFIFGRVEGQRKEPKLVKLSPRIHMRDLYRKHDLEHI